MAIHGWVMWVGWGLFGMAMIISARYMKQYWYINMYIHAFCGSVIMILNFFYGFGAIMQQKWRIDKGLHPIAGSILTIAGPIVTIGGIACRIFMNRLQWKSSRIIMLRTIH